MLAIFNYEKPNWAQEVQEHCISALRASRDSLVGARLSIVVKSSLKVVIVSDVDNNSEEDMNTLSRALKLWVTSITKEQYSGWEYFGLHCTVDNGQTVKWECILQEPNASRLDREIIMGIESASRKYNRKEPFQETKAANTFPAISNFLSDAERACREQMYKELNASKPVAPINQAPKNSSYANMMDVMPPQKPSKEERRIKELEEALAEKEAELKKLKIQNPQGPQAIDSPPPPYSLEEPPQVSIHFNY